MNQIIVTTKSRVKRECIGSAVHAHLVGLHEQLFYSGNRSYSTLLDNTGGMISGLITTMAADDGTDEIDICIKSVLKSEITVEHSILENESVKIVESI